MALRMVLGALLALAVFGGTARAAPFATPHVEIELVSARAAITPGETVTLALRQKVIPGWHTYWRNPGDSGEPTTITAWHMPRGFSAGALAWPAPETIPFTFLVNYGYGGEHLFPISLTVPRNAPIGREVTLAADITWLVCSDICIPEQGSASLTLAVAAQGRDDPIWAARIAAAEAALPKRANVAAHVTPGDPATLSIAAPDVGAIHDAYFFPYSRDAIDHAAPQHPRAGAGGLSFSLKAGAARDLGRGALDGVLTYRTTGGEQRAYEVHATPGPALADTATQAVAFTADFPLAAMLAGAEAPKPLALSVDIWAALALAFLGGLILNIMPCVLPVLTLKALSFAGGVQAGRIRREAWSISSACWRRSWRLRVC